ncbi:MAG: helix-turn-helix domain-containing protein [Ignavibacteriales bacterium]|nr:helix-turn-helix domain-containing protein [Ignavibacteriales bacterium]
MKHISLLVPARAKLLSIDTALQAFAEVNEGLKANGRSPMFNVQLVGLTKTIELNEGLYSVKADSVISEVEKTDLIIIPPVKGNLGEALELNREFFPWIAKQYYNGAEVASLCVGAFLLAATGLLKGKHCATHWRAANDFKKNFPDVHLMVDKIITDEQGIYSSGGALSATNLVLYLIEKYAGREVAIYCSKMFQVDIERISQSQFIIFSGQKNHSDDIVKFAQEFIESNFSEKITVDQLCDKFGVGRRTFERRFKAATYNSVIEYMQRVKVEAAKKQLELGRKTINEVMFGVGYTDTKAFREVFKKVTGMSPIDYRNKYSKEIAA